MQYIAIICVPSVKPLCAVVSVQNARARGDDDPAVSKQRAVIRLENFNGTSGYSLPDRCRGDMANKLPLPD
jgi:hypothetical protein